MAPRARTSRRPRRIRNSDRWAGRSGRPDRRGAVRGEVRVLPAILHVRTISRGRSMRTASICLVLLTFACPVHAEDTGPATPLQREILRQLDVMRPELVAMNQDIWNFAELGLEEFRSAARLVGVLKKAGFKVREGVSNMPTAFVAEYGSGKPVIGILAEYDALPDLSQDVAGQ